MSNAIADVTSIVQAACAVLGLAGLGLYVRETTTIRKHTQAQADATRRPVLMLTKLSFQSKKLQVTNVGIGPALNVEWSFIQDPGSYRMGSLAPQGRRLVAREGQTVLFSDLMREGDLKMTYRDTTNKPYLTIFRAVREGTRYIVETETEEV